MIIITRRIGESVTIDSTVTVALLGAKGRQARIGIDIPKGVPVLPGAN